MGTNQSLSSLDNQLHEMTITTPQPTPRRPRGPCLCGQNHDYRDCRALNPYTRNEQWEMRPKMIARINKKLHKKPFLRQYVLERLGYEYYQPLEQSYKHPKNPEAALPGIPVELLTKILEWVYAMTLDGHPSARPRLDNALETTHEPEERRGPVPSILNLPARSKNPYWRQVWLERNPGKWGQFSQVMYVSWKFYEIAKTIKYKEVHIIASDVPHWRDQDTMFPFNNICNRLATIQVLKEKTHHIHLTIQLLENQPLMDIVKALGKLPKLRHLAVTLKGDTTDHNSSMEGNNPDLMDFFDLQIETLTFIWIKAEINGCRILEPYDSTAESELAPVLTKAEHEMQQVRKCFIEQTYKASSWYSEASDDCGPIPPGKARLSHNWTPSRISNNFSYHDEHDRGFLQWETDIFTFKAGVYTHYPLWDLATDQRNHPDQLNREERAVGRPLRFWRKGFEPYTENELPRIESDAFTYGDGSDPIFSKEQREQIAEKEAEERKKEAEREEREAEELERERTREAEECAKKAMEYVMADIKYLWEERPEESESC